MKKVIALLTTGAAILPLASAASNTEIEAPVTQITENWKADSHILSVVTRVENLEESAFREVIDNYRKPDTTWPTDVAIRSLIVAAGVGYVPAQAEIAKCMSDGWALPSSSSGEDIQYKDRSNIENFWISKVCQSRDVDTIKSLRDFYKASDSSYKAEKLIARLNEIAPPEPEPEPEATTQSAAAPAPAMNLFNADGSPTDQTANMVIRNRFSLIVNKDATLEDFKKAFAENVMELKTSKNVTCDTLFKKQQTLDKNWPGRAVKILTAGISGRKIEINVAFVYKNPAKQKEVNGYNKITLVVDDQGRISGMSESISAGKAPVLSAGFKLFNYTAGEPLFIISQ
jgi:hypothetical protein